MDLLYGWYSEETAELIGSWFYLDENNNEVEVTFFTEDNVRDPNWAGDTRFVAKVEKDSGRKSDKANIVRDLVEESAKKREQFVGDLLSIRQQSDNSELIRERMRQEFEDDKFRKDDIDDVARRLDEEIATEVTEFINEPILSGQPDESLVSSNIERLWKATKNEGTVESCQCFIQKMSELDNEENARYSRTYQFYITEAKKQIEKLSQRGVNRHLNSTGLGQRIMGLFKKPKEKKEKGVYWGSTRLELLCMVVHFLEVKDTGLKFAEERRLAVMIADGLIPGIKEYLPQDKRTACAQDWNVAFSNVAQITNEFDSQCDIIFGQAFSPSPSDHNVGIDFSLALTYKSDRERPLITEMKGAKDWSHTLKVK